MSAQYPLYEEHTPNTGVYENVIASLRVQSTPLNTRFFSRANVDVLQDRIRASIKARMGYDISRQSDDQLLIAMRALYMQHGDHAPPNVDAELDRLNNIVLAEVLPGIAGGVRAYLGYVRDASRIPPPLERSVNTSIKGSKTYELFKGL